MSTSADDIKKRLEARRAAYHQQAGLAEPVASGRYDGPKPLDLDRVIREGVKPTPWLVEPHIVRNEIALMVGDGHVGKTTVAVDLGIGAALGQRVFIDCAIEEPLRVAYFFQDGSQLQIENTIATLAKGRGVKEGELENLNVFVRPGIQWDEKVGLRLLVDIVERFDPELLIFDAMSRFHAVPENENIRIARMIEGALRLLTEQGRTILIIHHANKESDLSRSKRGTRPRNPSSAIRGGTDYRNCTDRLLYMERVGNSTVMYPDKDRWSLFQEAPAPLVLQLERRNDGGLVYSRGTLPGPILGKGAAAECEIIEVADRLLESSTSFSWPEVWTLLPGRATVKSSSGYGERTAQEALAKLSDPSDPDAPFRRSGSGKNTRYSKRPD